VSLFNAEKVSEVDRFWREMAPVPGRMTGSLRFALTSALATLLLLILQPPVGFIVPSMFMLFLVSHESPLSCLRDLMTLLSGAALGTIVILLMMIVTGDHPVARVVGLAVCTFVAAFFFRTSVVPGFPMAFGCLTYMVISLWEYPIRDERILHLSLWPLGTLSIVAFSAMLVEVLFNRSDPLASLRREIKIRCGALDRLFQLCAKNAEPDEIERQSAIVRRYSVTGEGRLHALLEQISNRKICGEPELRKLRASVMTLDRLFVLGSAFALQGDPLGEESARLERIGKAILAIGDAQFAQARKILGDSQAPSQTELDRIEQSARHLAESAESPATVEPVTTSEPAPSFASWKGALKKLLLPDAFTNPDHVIYALKLSLCATICYVIYQGLAWPGISTSFFTVYFTGLSTTGTTNRKLFFRIIGSTVGGMILGIGCLVFVFPNLEGVQGFLLVIAAVSFIGAWVAASPHFGYLGLQTTFSFNLIALERLRAADQMTPARDRLLGITLGFLVMFVIFHQVRPERTVDTMRRLLSRVLRAQAAIIRLSSGQPSAAEAAKLAEINRQIVTMASTLANFAHAVQYEFPPDRDGDMRVSNEILAAAAKAEDLLICVRAWPLELDGKQSAERLQSIRDSFENALANLARALEQCPEHDQLSQTWEVAAEQDVRSAEPGCFRKAIDSFLELQMACDGILRSAKAQC
jgi:multidrug resistance protein MdtO